MVPPPEARNLYCEVFFNSPIRPSCGELRRYRFISQSSTNRYKRACSWTSRIPPSDLEFLQRRLVWRKARLETFVSAGNEAELMRYQDSQKLKRISDMPKIQKNKRPDCRR